MPYHAGYLYVRPQMNTVSRVDLSELHSLVGLKVDAVFQDESYWHLVVALRCSDGHSIVFSTEAVGIAKYFEVFPIKVRVEPTEHRAWRGLGQPKAIHNVRPLVRQEWLEPVDRHPELIGNAPHHAHHAGCGPSPSHAVQTVEVQAGIELRFSVTDSMLVYASGAVPLNVELATTPAEVKSVLAGFKPTDA